MEGVPLDQRRIDRSSGGLTDDTILTLATAETIASSGVVDPARIAEQLLATFRDGVPGNGSSTLGAMQSLAAGSRAGKARAT